MRNPSGNPGQNEKSGHGNDIMRSRSQILSNIRTAQRKPDTQAGSKSFLASKSKPGYRLGNEAIQGSLRQKAGLIDAFKRECELVSGCVYVVENAREARHALYDLFKKTGVKRILRAESPVLHHLGLDDLIDSLGIEDLSPLQHSDDYGVIHINPFKRMAQAEMGITGVDYGLADTGTLVLCAGPEQDRTVSILPPIHVAIMDSGKILPHSDELIDHLIMDFSGTGRLGDYLTLITGPSRTADIELNLVLGVHGPKELHVIILDLPL
jgi:L-lactate dehydrogenase complex protein LldG